jgi:mycothiol synthase
MQLQMIWPASKWETAQVQALPLGYTLRTGRREDAEAVVAVLVAAGFAEWTIEMFGQWLDRTIPDGLWLVEQTPGGPVVCCTWAVHAPKPIYPFGGELGWVGCRPEHTGQGLSSVTCAAVVRRFRQAGYRCLYLQTDDPRLPAIKTYLKLGWIPNLVEADLAGRWQAVCEKLGWPCDLEGWTREAEATKARW